MPKHYDGSKLRGTHTTMMDASVAVVNKLVNTPLVKGILLGFIDARVRSRKPRVKVEPVPAGLKLSIFGNIGKQTVFVYTDQSSEVAKMLEEFG